jgi:hypothetical protein
MENINEHDMTKKMLDSIRNGGTANSLNENVQNVQPTNQSQQLDEHDMTKNMLAKIRTSSTIAETKSVAGGLLTEEFESNDVVKVEDDELGEESGKLRDMVGGVDLKLYEVYPKDRNVVMVGVLDNGIEFKFAKKEGAPYINVSNMRLDSDAVESIKRLEAYYKDWTVTWAEKISEYSRNV